MHRTGPLDPGLIVGLGLGKGTPIPVTLAPTVLYCTVSQGDGGGFAT
jgi:hypothetical protein